MPCRPLGAMLTISPNYAKIRLARGCWSPVTLPFLLPADSVWRREVIAVGKKVDSLCCLRDIRALALGDVSSKRNVAAQLSAKD